LAQVVKDEFSMTFDIFRGLPLAGSDFQDWYSKAA